uniref:mitogen-activated protein kinase kinase kinase n=1 Tax=Anthurium amnicola TaxID=1678845 RepID=A0A1D1Z7X6_9ARAE
MPAWWRGKSRSNSSSSSSSSSGSSNRKKEPAALPVKPDPGVKLIKKEKAKSFDELLAVRNYRCAGDRSPIASDLDGGNRCHPLPPPLVSLSPMTTLDHGATQGPATAAVGSASGSVSSISSSGTDEGPDLAFHRYSESLNTPRGRSASAMPDCWKQQRHVVEDRQLFSCSPVFEHERLNDFSLSPRKEFQLHDPDIFSDGRGPSSFITSVEAATKVRSRSPGPESRRYNLPTSPMHPRTLGTNAESPTGKQEDLKSPHPLPLPPSSPTSSTSYVLQSKWKKGKLIGRGTFGHVFLGFNSESGQMCAIKEVKVISDDSNSKECLKQLSQEITLLSQLLHPNIVQYYGSEVVEETLSVYLEYLSGGSIHKLLQEYGPFGEPVIRSYTAQILSGLAYLHGRNTVHRDIKGANILVDPNGEVKLADFGMAKHISSYNSIRSFKGSPYWMAPEVIMNAGGYNLSVDIWSLGCTILEMATSKPPWCQYEGVAAIFKIGNSKDIPEIPSHLSNDGKEFLKLCLQRDPSARPTAAQLMEHPFVRDQASSRFARSNMVRDPFPSSLEGAHTPTSEFPNYRSTSPLRDRDYPMRHTVAGYAAIKCPSDLVSMRMNFSLPVSPCSSPLRSFRQSTLSCYPSPPHPAYVGGASSAGLSNYSLNPIGGSKNYLDPWLEISQLRPQTPAYDSPRTGL